MLLDVESEASVRVCGVGYKASGVRVYRDMFLVQTYELHVKQHFKKCYRQCYPFGEQ